MTASNPFHCIVDDTALSTNISDIESWVTRGIVHLVVPLHSQYEPVKNPSILTSPIALERLHLLKKDTSQIGQNARKAVKFLDDVTSNPELESRVVIQGPDDQYPTWAEVEAHYNDITTGSAEDEPTAVVGEVPPHGDADSGRSKETIVEPGESLPHVLFETLDVSKAPKAPSPMSTPPLSPSSSGPQSSKPSPEARTAELLANDISPVPQTLKPLINPVVWYTHHMKNKSPSTGILYLTNSSDNSILTRDFGVTSTNIHQLRAAIGVEDQEGENHARYQKKHSESPKPSTEPKTLFRYEEDDSEDEEVVFKPRGRGASRATTNSRGGNTGSIRSRKGPGHSPANSLGSLPTPHMLQAKPQIPVGEIDPDSFDRGSFGRGSQPLANVGNFQTPPQQHNPNRSHNNHNHNARSNASNGGQSRNGVSRGGRGFERGAARGRGRLFVP